MKSAAIALLCVLGGGCCTCPPPGLPANIQHAMGEPYQAPTTTYTGDLLPVAQRIFARYSLPHYHYEHTDTLYGAADYWPSPSETHQVRRGDCKAFAVAEYFDALAAGVPEDQLSIWVVVLLENGEIHAVLIMGDYVVDRFYNRVSTMAEAKKNYGHLVRFNRQGFIAGGL